ncbi:hypothetical protein [Pseudomonas sp. NBRC 111121]|uniref:hypothetical protein n=1 Tax=Pseudomonas sp. NBRC 111121 TaxID=1661036 RepID=UPI000761B81B|nr:hypothetical protein [Pseudomonas sp. NBRC 111121]
MNLINTILKVASVISLLTLATTPSFSANQQNLSYSDFDADEISIITKSNQAHHDSKAAVEVIKTNSDANQINPLERINIFIGFEKAVEFTKDLIRKEVESDGTDIKKSDDFKLPPKSMEYYVIGLLICLLIISDKISIIYKSVKNFIFRKIQTDAPICPIKYELDIITKNFASAGIAVNLILILWIVYDAIFKLSYFYVFTPILNTPSYESLITNDLVPVVIHLQELIQSSANSIKSIIDSIAPLIVFVLIVLLYYFFMLALKEEMAERKEKNRKIISAEIEKHLNHENLEKLEYEKIKKGKDKNGEN